MALALWFRSSKPRLNSGTLGNVFVGLAADDGLLHSRLLAIIAVGLGAV